LLGQERVIGRWMPGLIYQAKPGSGGDDSGPPRVNQGNPPKPDVVEARGEEIGSSARRKVDAVKSRYDQLAEKPFPAPAPVRQHGIQFFDGSGLESG
jgi:hypothetical protein